MSTLRLSLLLACTACVPPQIGAHLILHPPRFPVLPALGMSPEEVELCGDGLVLRGWLFRAQPPGGGRQRRALVLYLHGITNNRSQGLEVARRLPARGYDVLMLDFRAHGASDGTLASFGHFEKEDVRRAIDKFAGSDPVVLLGESYGAAIALQTAALEPRVAAVVAMASFATLERAIRDRTPFFASEQNIREAMALVERESGYRIASVSPVESARHIRVPTLLIHGTLDRETRPEHSARIFQALESPKRMLLIDGAQHSDVLNRPAVVDAIAGWLAELPLTPPG
jgi:uncharacterized protein